MIWREDLILEWQVTQNCQSCVLCLVVAPSLPKDKMSFFLQDPMSVLEHYLPLQPSLSSIWPVTPIGIASTSSASSSWTLRPPSSYSANTISFESLIFKIRCLDWWIRSDTVINCTTYKRYIFDCWINEKLIFSLGKSTPSFCRCSPNFSWIQYLIKSRAVNGRQYLI